MTEEVRNQQQRCPMTPTTKARVKELHDKYGVSLGDLVAWAAELRTEYEQAYFDITKGTTHEHE